MPCAVPRGPCAAQPCRAGTAPPSRLCHAGWAPGPAAHGQVAQPHTKRPALKLRLTHATARPWHGAAARSMRGGCSASGARDAGVERGLGGARGVTCAPVRARPAWVKAAHSSVWCTPSCPKTPLRARSCPREGPGSWREWGRHGSKGGWGDFTRVGGVNEGGGVYEGGRCTRAGLEAT